MGDQINVKVTNDMKNKLSEKGINPYEVAKKAWEEAIGERKDLDSLMKREETLFGEWADTFIDLYQFINKKLADRDALLVAEEAKLREVWKRVEARMKSRAKLFEDIPELTELKFIDCFNWQKIFEIIEKYPQTLKGRLGVVQIREGILYREVEKGNFTSIQEAQKKLRTELELRITQVKKELQDWTKSEDFRREWLLKQEELKIEEQKKRQEEGM